MHTGHDGDFRHAIGTALRKKRRGLSLVESSCTCMFSHPTSLDERYRTVVTARQQQASSLHAPKRTHGTFAPNAGCTAVHRNTQRCPSIMRRSLVCAYRDIPSLYSSRNSHSACSCIIGKNSKERPISLLLPLSFQSGKARHSETRDRRTRTAIG